MSGDTLVYDMANSSSEMPSIFVKKDYLSVIDENSQNYNGNQVVISSSALANSSKYINYREGYLQIPLLLTLTGDTGADNKFSPATAATSGDHAIGLKNAFHTIINDFSVDLNGQTIIQQSRLLPLYNNFRLMTTMSWNDVKAIGPTIGFHPDNALSASFHVNATPANTTSKNGLGAANNQNAGAFTVVTGAHNSFDAANEGFLKRQQGINFNPSGLTDVTGVGDASAFSALLTATNCNSLRKSYVFNTQNAATSGSVKGIMQIAVTAICPLKYLADFFDKMCLAKGLYMRLTAGISNSSVAYTIASDKYSAATVTNNLGGVLPLMLASTHTGNGAASLPDDSYRASVCVGGSVLDTTQSQISGIQSSPLAQSVTLNTPAYVFNPIYEQQYLSKPIKEINYTDIYQYSIQNVAANAQVNQLISNGVADMRKLILLPFFSKNDAGNHASFVEYNSPFSTAGGGTTALCAHVSNLNFVVSGMNVFYNQQKYLYQSFLEQLYGLNAINGGQTDGLNSSLVSQLDFETSYAYYVANVERQLPIERSVPKSLSVQFQNMSARMCDYILFVEYGQSLSIDILTGSKVA